MPAACRMVSAVASAPSPKPFSRSAATGRSVASTISLALARASSRLTLPSRLPSTPALAPLDVASASKPMPASMRAEPPSHGLAITKAPGASCRARNFLALSAWLTVMSFPSVLCLEAAAVVLLRLQLVDLDVFEAAQVDADCSRAIRRHALGERLDAALLAMAMMQMLLAELIVAQRIGAGQESHLRLGREGPDGAEPTADGAIALQGSTEIEIDREGHGVAMTAAFVILCAHVFTRLRARSKASKLRQRLESTFTVSGALQIKGTRCSEMPPW